MRTVKAVKAFELTDTTPATRVDAGQTIGLDDARAEALAGEGVVEIVGDFDKAVLEDAYTPAVPGVLVDGKSVVPQPRTDTTPSVTAPRVAKPRTTAPAP